MSHDCPTPFSPKATPQLILAFILTFGLFVAPTYAIRMLHERLDHRQSSSQQLDNTADMPLKVFLAPLSSLT
jgi:capsular polysaccharide biosynthesis protein